MEMHPVVLMHYTISYSGKCFFKWRLKYFVLITPEKAISLLTQN